MPKLARLKDVRERELVTQVELAERTGIAQSTISNIERGSAARFATVRKLAEALGVEPRELIGDRA